MIASILFLAGIFILLRRIERWLHQHIFKVGWLSTHNYQTTTILYYTIFLPGIILHEVVYYLAAGVFNVRAERKIKWPDEQEMGELKLNFIKIPTKTSPFRKALITSSPLLAGLVCIWLIANNIFDITTVVERMSTGELTDIGAAFSLLISAPLFWLWIYIIFTIANTMFPTVPKDLQGWRSVLIGLGVVGLALFLLGIGGEIFEALQTPISTIILVLAETFILLICIDLLMVLVLGLIEYSIERITGHSATFRGNRMYTMTREEAITERSKNREREQKKVEREQRRKQADTGPISIYSFSFSIPGAPSTVKVTKLEPLPGTEKAPLETAPEEEKPSMPHFGGLSEGSREVEKPSEEEKQQREAIASRINIPSRRPPVSAPSEKETTDKKEEKPAASLSADKVAPSTKSRFGVTPPSSRDDESKNLTEDKTTAPVASQFRVKSPVSTEDVNKNEKPAASISSRFGTKPSPADTDKGEKSATPATSRFGVKPSPADIDKDDSKDEKGEKPAASLSSRFSRSDTESTSEKTVKETIPAPEDDEEIRVVGRPASPSLLDEDDDDEALDESIARRGRGDDSVTSLFGQLDGESDDRDKDSSASPSTSRFGQTGSNRFGSRFGKLSSTEDDEEDSEDESIGSRFKSPSSGLSSRFGKSTSPLSPTSSDDKGEDSSGSPSSRFGNSRPAPKSPLSGDDKDDETETSSGLSNIRPSASLSSRPAPKPSASIEDGEDDLLEDEVVYEDIEDEYAYEDDEDYIEYDDDEVYYEDDDD